MKKTNNTKAEATTSATKAVPTRRRRRRMVNLPDHTGLGWTLPSWEDSQAVPGVILGPNGGVRINPRSVFAELA